MVQNRIEAETETEVEVEDARVGSSVKVFEGFGLVLAFATPDRLKWRIERIMGSLSGTADPCSGCCVCLG